MATQQEIIRPLTPELAEAIAQADDPADAKLRYFRLRDRTLTAPGGTAVQHIDYIPLILQEYGTEWQPINIKENGDLGYLTSRGEVDIVLDNHTEPTTYPFGIAVQSEASSLGYNRQPDREAETAQIIASQLPGGVVKPLRSSHIVAFNQAAEEITK